MHKAMYERPVLNLQRFDKEDVVVMSGGGSALNTYGNSKSAGSIGIMSLLGGKSE